MRRKKKRGEEERKGQERQRAGEGRTKRWKNRMWERSGKGVSTERGRGKQTRMKSVALVPEIRILNL